MLKTIVRWQLISFISLTMGMVAGCGSGDGDSDNASSNRWVLSSSYHYEYNDSGQRIREVDDNNLNNRIDDGDVTWTYSYDDDGLRIAYFRYDGSDAQPDGIGTYYYDGNECNWRLEEETSQGTVFQTWTYDVDLNCNRRSYSYEGNGGRHTGTYSRNGDGFVTRLSLGSGEHWDYTLDDFGERLYYDFYSAAGDLYRYGIYYYDEAGRLVQLDNYAIFSE